DPGGGQGGHGVGQADNLALYAGAAVGDGPDGEGGRPYSHSTLTTS
ncbi:MAG: hypothetical protein JWM33_412, partial [Caulobacteraceae bacterium]|nr:hypothetical protein [Caulobacteraceae bacterium]